VRRHAGGSEHYDYRRAGRDAVHFGSLVDRCGRTCGGVVGYEVQYFATVDAEAALRHLHSRGGGRSRTT